MTETTDPTAQTAEDAGAPTPPDRTADWTLIQLSGALRRRVIEEKPVEFWDGRWVATNQRGDVYLYGEWGDCWRSAQHWARYGPPRGAAEGEDGTGWRGPVPGLEDAP